MAVELRAATVAMHRVDAAWVLTSTAGDALDKQWHAGLLRLDRAVSRALWEVQRSPDARDLAELLEAERGLDVAATPSCGRID